MLLIESSFCSQWMTNYIVVLPFVLAYAKGSLRKTHSITKNSASFVLMRSIAKKCKHLVVFVFENVVGIYIAPKENN